MKEYIEEIPREKLLTKEAAMSEFNGFVIRLFKTLGYEMEMTFRDDHTTGKRTVRARWREKETEKPLTKYDLLLRKSPEEMASFIQQVEVESTCAGDRSYMEILDWLKQEADHAEN